MSNAAQPTGGILIATDHYRHEPFQPRLLDAVWIAATALGISLLAMLYPTRSATRIVPVETLRQE